MTLYKNKYRTETSRLVGYDYSQNGSYFVTICTKNRLHIFGNVDDNKMYLNEVGKIAFDCWESIPKHFPFIRLGEFVIMPNHIHGVLIFEKGGYNSVVETQNSVETQNFASLQQGNEPKGNIFGPQSQNFASLQQGNESKGNIFGPQSQNLASVIRGFKIGVTKYARANTDFVDIWQPRFHDRIIRDSEEQIRIENYIIHNPASWKSDSLYS